MQIRLDPPNRQQRNDALEEIAHRRETDAMLQERRRLDEDVRGRVNAATQSEWLKSRTAAPTAAAVGAVSRRTVPEYAP